MPENHPRYSPNLARRALSNLPLQSQRTVNNFLALSLASDWDLMMKKTNNGYGWIWYPFPSSFFSIMVLFFFSLALKGSPLFFLGQIVFLSMYNLVGYKLGTVWTWAWIGLYWLRLLKMDCLSALFILWLYSYCYMEPRISRILRIRLYVTCNRTV